MTRGEFAGPLSNTALAHPDFTVKPMVEGNFFSEPDMPHIVMTEGQDGNRGY
jgi:hypothetical protein